MMIEQALAIATTNGGTTQATIQIPCNLTLDSVIHIDGQNNVEMGQDGVLNDCSANMSGRISLNLFTLARWHQKPKADFSALESVSSVEPILGDFGRDAKNVATVGIQLFTSCRIGVHSER
ncbi:hypothetical protein DPMN_022290 [Dreissena polymorpha]|uniref:Uncharacterized protein n=1 Tax=Dreissena polymorpha TaxID=45954 RepID=A0A9D4NP74_DREPO|nr:hypothetical protein DPMN_022290 [Dreissena polymorpha]